MDNSSNLIIIKLKYLLKKFLLYFSYGVTCAVFPFVFGAALGLPSVLLAAIALAFADLINLEIDDNKKQLIVFSKAHTIILCVLILLVTSYAIIILTNSGHQISW